MTQPRMAAVQVTRTSSDRPLAPGEARRLTRRLTRAHGLMGHVTTHDGAAHHGVVGGVHDGQLHLHHPDNPAAVTKVPLGSIADFDHNPVAPDAMGLVSPDLVNTVPNQQLYLPTRS